jgi:hypothetical protein
VRQLHDNRVVFHRQQPAVIGPGYRFFIIKNVGKNKKTLKNVKNVGKIKNVKNV